VFVLNIVALYNLKVVDLCRGAAELRGSRFFGGKKYAF
jgi:hypothetical protein